MEIRSRPMTIEEQFFKRVSNPTQQTIINSKLPDPVIKPVTLVSKPELAGKQLYSPDFLTSTGDFVNNNLLTILVIAIVGGGAVWFYMVKKNKALRDSEAAELANQKVKEQAPQSAVQMRPSILVREEQTSQNSSNEDSIELQVNRDWKQDYQQPI